MWVREGGGGGREIIEEAAVAVQESEADGWTRVGEGTVGSRGVFGCSSSAGREVSQGQRSQGGLPGGGDP